MHAIGCASPGRSVTCQSIERELAEGTLKYSAVRELTRVAVRANEGKWLADARGKNLRQIEEMVSGRRRGDDPDATPPPEHRLRKIPFEDISAETYALVREVRIALADEAGEHLDDDPYLATLCRRVLEANGNSTVAQPSHQIAVTMCEHCKRAWQIGGGRKVELTPTAIEHATCDANHIGSLDADKPERAKADIPPATRRLVMQRDHGQCTVPGCRSARGLDLHHVVHREHGGDHDPRNLTTTCFFHHQQAHDGLLEITGRAPDQLRFVRRDAGVAGTTDLDDSRGVRTPEVVRRHLDPPAPAVIEAARATFEQIEIETQARDALVGMGFRPAEARAAVEQAKNHVGRNEVTLEEFLRVALSKAPKPKSG